MATRMRRRESHVVNCIGAGTCISGIGERPLWQKNHSRARGGIPSIVSAVRARKAGARRPHPTQLLETAPSERPIYRANQPPSTVSTLP
jgi:hypothetical protein